MNTIFPNREWTFDEEVAGIFDTHIRRSVPFYDEVQRMVVELSNPFLKNNSVVCDIGTGTGEVVRQVNKAYRKRNLTFFAIDNSDAMLKKAAVKCKLMRNVEFVCDDIIRLKLPKADLVTAIYTMQFIPKGNRQKVFNKIYKSLNMGGAFILCEKIGSCDEFINSHFVEFHENLKRRNRFSDEEILAKKISLVNVMKPATYIGNISMLRRSGFAQWHSFFQWYNFIGLISVKD